MTIKLSRPKIDSALRPQDDFYRHVNNIWLKDHPIPDSESRWGIFPILRDQAWSKMRDIYEELQSSEAKDIISRQAKDFYHTGMHFDDLATQHHQTINKYVTKIEGISNTSDLSFAVGELHRMGVNVPWSMVIDTDDADATRYLVRLYQAGLSLPDRDYYLASNKEMAQIRLKYKQLLTSVHDIFKDIAPDSEFFVETIIDMELALAKKQHTNVQLRDIEKNYHPISFADLKKTYKNIDWARYTQGAKWSYTKNISHDQPNFMAYIDQQFGERSLEQWKVYLKWQLIRKFLPSISSETAALHYSFFSKVISGTKENLPLWKRVVLTIDWCIGENVGKLYVQRHFPEESKKKVLSIVEEVSRAFSQRIARLDWMNDDTKNYAIKKLNNIKVLIGYPDKWRDFSDLKITRNSYVDNIIASEIYNHDFTLSKLGQPNNRDEWGMSPQTVNAYHDPNRLVICFPAGILQAPFFDSQASDAQNFSGIGTVIGHELSHGFDDQGCQFDANGNVRQWQTEGERKTFAQRAKVIIDQADHFEVLPGLRLKGDLVIGESIADLGGVELGLEALRGQIGSNITNKDIRAFFINYAFTEAGSTREQKTREFALTDPHPPGTFRVNAILAHVDSFYEAFSLVPTDNLYRPKKNRAKIW